MATSLRTPSGLVLSLSADEADALYLALRFSARGDRVSRALDILRAVEPHVDPHVVTLADKHLGRLEP